MRLRLLDPHTVPVGPGSHALFPRGTILEALPPGMTATPRMEGLDEEGRAAVAHAHLVAFGRYPWPYGLYPPSGEPLDDPPIPRPLEENQPVFHYTGNKEYIS